MAHRQSFVAVELFAIMQMEFGYSSHSNNCYDSDRCTRGNKTSLRQGTRAKRNDTGKSFEKRWAKYMFSLRIPLQEGLLAEGSSIHNSDSIFTQLYLKSVLIKTFLLSYLLAYWLLKQQTMGR